MESESLEFQWHHSLFDVYAGDVQGHKVISLVFLFIFLSCGVYNLHFKTCFALYMTLFLLFLEQLELECPLDNKAIDNMDFHHQWNWKPFRAGIDAYFTPAADMLGLSVLVSEPLPR